MVLFICVVAGFFFLHQDRSGMQNLTCRSDDVNYVVMNTRQTDRFNASYYLSLSKGIGIVAIQGDLFIDGKMYYVNRNAKVTYDYVSPNDLLLRVSSTYKNMGERDSVTQKISDVHLIYFLLAKDSEIAFHIYGTQDDAIVLGSASLPQFYCKRSKPDLPYL